MKIKIYNQQDNLLIDNNKLKDIKTQYEYLTADINGVSFETDQQSLLRLDIISHSDNVVNFKTYENKIIPLSGSEIANYLTLLKTKLANRYSIINDIYYDLKEEIGTLTYTHAISVFESLDI